jgi:hypothetical protein
LEGLCARFFFALLMGVGLISQTNV